MSFSPTRNPNYAKFSPTDSGFPRMKIAMSCCPKDFFTRPQDYANMVFVAQIDKWDLVSSHLDMALEKQLASLV